jgi:predicted Holliday junction resolvase-like endonuclease
LNQLNQWGLIAVIVVVYLLGIYLQNRRIDDLKDSINKRFDDMRDLIRSETKHLEERIDRLEHPVVRER